MSSRLESYCYYIFPIFNLTLQYNTDLCYMNFEELDQKLIVISQKVLSVRHDWRSADMKSLHGAMTYLGLVSRYTIVLHKEII